MISPRKVYKKYFYISPLDLADFAERTGLEIITCAGLHWQAVFLHYLDFCSWHVTICEKTCPRLFFFVICIVVNLLSIILSKIVKHAPREKAYILKNIPLYTVFTWGMTSCVYNFYLQKSPFIGVITFFNAVLIMLCVFSVCVHVFFVLVCGAFCGIAPGLLENFGLTGFLYFTFITGLMITLAAFLRYRDKQYVMALKKQKKSLEVKTFGNFTALYDKKTLKFARSKSNELLAYLIYKNGSSVNTKELLAVLYGDHADSSRYGASLRLLIADIKHTLAELEIQNFFITEYNNFRINPEVVQCDYYDFLSGDSQAAKAFTGEFMNQYSWAEDVAAFLERKVCGAN